MKSLLRRMIVAALPIAVITVITIPCAMAQSLGAHVSMHSVLQTQGFNRLGPQPEPPDSSLRATMPAVSVGLGYNRARSSSIAAGQRITIQSNSRSHAMGTPMPIPPSSGSRFGRR
jgi:hypothetical protein